MTQLTQINTYVRVIYIPREHGVRSHQTFPSRLPFPHPKFRPLRWKVWRARLMTRGEEKGKQKKQQSRETRDRSDMAKKKASRKNSRAKRQETDEAKRKTSRRNGRAERREASKTERTVSQT